LTLLVFIVFIFLVAIAAQPALWPIFFLGLFKLIGLVVLFLLCLVLFFWVLSLPFCQMAKAFGLSATPARVDKTAPHPAACRTPHTDPPTNKPKPKKRVVPVQSTAQLTWSDLVLPQATLAHIQLTLQLLTDETKRRLVPSPPRGLLLWGPPGTGKTQVARVIASCGRFNFYTIGSAKGRGQFIGQD